jgi:hypothetical protein
MLTASGFVLHRQGSGEFSAGLEEDCFTFSRATRVVHGFQDDGPECGSDCAWIRIGCQPLPIDRFDSEHYAGSRIKVLQGPLPVCRTKAEKEVEFV